MLNFYTYSSVEGQCACDRIYEITYNLQKTPRLTLVGTFSTEPKVFETNALSMLVI